MTAQYKWIALACLALVFVGCDDDGGDDGAGGEMSAGGAMAGGAMTGGSMAGGAMPGGAMPGGAMPGGAMPGGAMPGGAMPGGAMPGGAMPGGAMPGGMMGTGGAMPQCSEASDCAEGETCVEGQCQEDPCVCGEIYMPVCGADGVTYSNACEAMCAGVESTVEGECGDPGACEESADCGEAGEDCDFHCIENMCVPNCGAPCENDEACLAGQTCDRGRCEGVPVCPDPASPEVTYISMDVDQCDAIEIMCAPGQMSFDDHCGCGCLGEAMGGECECPPGGALVCGVDGMTYPSACEATCVDVRVAYEGPCAPDDCEPLMDCMLECPMGYALNAMGCETCACAMGGGGLCDDFYYATCENDDECRDGYVCRTPMQECVASDCQCSPDDNMVVCTDDCAMGVGLCNICPIGLPIEDCIGDFGR